MDIISKKCLTTENVPLRNKKNRLKKVLKIFTVFSYQLIFFSYKI